MRYYIITKASTVPYKTRFLGYGKSLQEAYADAGIPPHDMSVSVSIVGESELQSILWGD